MSMQHKITFMAADENDSLFVKLKLTTFLQFLTFIIV